jgi:hypothetical protein
MSAPVQQATIRQYAKQLRLATVGGQFVQVGMLISERIKMSGTSVAPLMR